MANTGNGRNRSNSNRAAGSNNRKKTSDGNRGGRRTDNNNNTLYEEDRSELATELLIWIVLVVSIVLLLCVFNLCGPLSNVFGAFLFGMFGSVAYIFPFVLFLSICFYQMNSDNSRLVRKVIYSWILYIIIASIIELFAGDKSGNIGNCYVNGYKTHIGGGFIGGCISRGLSAVMGNLATGIILFVAAIMLFVLITGKLIASIALDNGTQKYNEYMETRREERRRRFEEDDEDDDIDYDNLPIDDNAKPARRKKRFSYTFPKKEPDKADTKNGTVNVREVESGDMEDIHNNDRLSAADGSLSQGAVSVREQRTAGNENSAASEYGLQNNSGVQSDYVSDDNKNIHPDMGMGQTDNASEEVPIYEQEIINKFGTEHPITDNSLERLVARALESDRIQYTEYSPYVDDDRIVSNGMVDESVFDVPSHSSYDDVSADNGAEDSIADNYSNNPYYNEPVNDSLESYDSPVPYNNENESNDDINVDIEKPDDIYMPYNHDSESSSNIQDEPYSSDNTNNNRADMTSTGESVSPVNQTSSSQQVRTVVNKQDNNVTYSAETGNSDNEGEVNIEMPPEPIPYIFPSLDLLERPAHSSGKMSEEDLKETARKLQDCLKSFKVDVTMTDIICGPTVTRYELQPSLGTRVKKITELENDIKLNLAAADIRIEAPIPGKSAVGIEVPNTGSVMIPLREMLETKEFRSHKSNVAFGVGKDIGGHNIVADIAKMPHMLIAGATGSGKSVCINTIVMSILYKADPNDVKLIMIDPKVVELSVYNGIPHLCIPVVTDPKKAAAALNWAVAEMNDRYRKFAELGVRDMKGFNSKIEQLRENPNMYVKMPQIVIIVDELADLMMVASHDVEAAICRLAQMARAAGLHLIIATQRPSVDVITGLIKANVPSRIAFAVSSAIDSRTILDGAGAEKLLGKGDMLFFPQGMPKPIRVQGAFVSDAEVARVTDFVKGQYSAPVYDTSISEKISNAEAGGSNVDVSADSSDENPNGWDEKFEEAGRFIIEKQKASIGTLQRVFKIGFNRGARIMDQLCEAGVVSEEDGKKPRNILMTMEEFDRLLEEGKN